MRSKWTPSQRRGGRQASRRRLASMSTTLVPRVRRYIARCAVLAMVITPIALSSSPSPAAATAPGAAVYSFGDNSGGQLGDGTRVDRLTPVGVPGLDDAVKVAAGADNAVALTGDGALFGWGTNYGQLGAQPTNPVTSPVSIGGFTAGSGIGDVAAGAHHVLALRNDGTVFAWGADDFGQLGDDSPGGTQNTPTPVAGLGAGSGVVAIAAGENHSLALTSDGRVLAWGDNLVGQLGDG